MKKILQILALLSLLIGFVFLTYISLANTTTSTPRGIPLILDSTCTYWVDQYGNQISIKSADQYFNKHVYIAQGIFELNSDPCYASRLSSREREQFLQEKEETLDYSSAHKKSNYFQYEFDSISSVYLSLVKDADHRPSREALSSLEDHLSDGHYAKSVVREIVYDCNTTNEVSPLEGFEINDGWDKFDGIDVNTMGVFLVALASLSENETIDSLCLQPEDMESVPLVMSSDAVWHDQNGKALGDEEAETWLKEHRDFGYRIVKYNQFYNPYLDDSNAVEATNKLWSLEPQLNSSYAYYEIDAFDYPCYTNAMFHSLQNKAEVVKSLRGFTDYLKLDHGTPGYYLDSAYADIIDSLDHVEDKLYGSVASVEGHAAEMYILALCNIHRSTWKRYPAVETAIQSISKVTSVIEANLNKDKSSGKTESSGSESRQCSEVSTAKSNSSNSNIEKKSQSEKLEAEDNQAFADSEKNEEKPTKEENLSSNSTNETSANYADKVEATSKDEEQDSDKRSYSYSEWYDIPGYGVVEFDIEGYSRTNDTQTGDQLYIDAYGNVYIEQDEGVEKGNGQFWWQHQQELGYTVHLDDQISAPDSDNTTRH